MGFTEMKRFHRTLYDKYSLNSEKYSLISFRFHNYNLVVCFGVNSRGDSCKTSREGSGPGSMCILLKITGQLTHCRLCLKN